MTRLPFFKVLSALVLLSASSCFAQFGYVTQAPAGAAGMAAAGAVDPYAAAGGMMYANQGYGGMPAAANAMMPGAPASNLLTYGQLEARYNYMTHSDKTLESGNGIGVGLMAQLFQPFFLHGEFNWTGGSEKRLSKNYTFSTVSIGAGAYIQLTQQIHLVGEIGGLYSSLSASKTALSFDDGAIYVNPSLRIAATNDLELDIGVMLTSADNYNARVLELGGYYKLFSSMDLGLGADLGDEDNTYHLGVRFRW